MSETFDRWRNSSRYFRVAPPGSVAADQEVWDACEAENRKPQSPETCKLGHPGWALQVPIIIFESIDVAREVIPAHCLICSEIAKARETELVKARAELRVSIGEVWHWQGDGYDHPESLTCPILIQPAKLIEILRKALVISTFQQWLDAHQDRLAESWAELQRVRAEPLRSERR